MDAVLPYRAMAYNNGWANHRLLIGLRRSYRRPNSPRRAPVSSRACSATLNHILIIDLLLRRRHGGRHARPGGLGQPGALRDRDR